MIGTNVGPYRLLSELGAGGMGRVYLAEVVEEAPGTEVGAKVAVKVVHPHLLAAPGFFKRFLREAEVGKQVRHENVVRTFDADATVVDGQSLYYLVLEYVEGKSLRRLLEDLKVVPESLLREIAMQMADGLAAIHGLGIVHRDLKPENVLITDDHRVRIMDLGVAKLQEASVALTKEGHFAGSFLYAAPEQFAGGGVGPAADLYSLGVLLHEMATGDNPFRRDDPAAVIHAHLSGDPPRPIEKNPEVSPFLSEVISSLVVKDPKARLGPAETLAKVLGEAERSAWWAEREKAIRGRDQRLPKIPVRRDTALHGRTDLLALLKGAWRDATQGRASTVLLEGEAGIGRTRLVAELVRSLAGEDAHVLYGSYPPSGGMGGISDAVLAKFGESGLDAALKPYVAPTPSLLPAFAALLKHESPPTGAEPLRGDSLHTVFCHLMRGLAAEKPTLWVVDDLHFAPEESRLTFLSMARAVLGHKALLVATARPGLPEEYLAHLTRLENFRRVTVPRLGARDVIEVLREVFKSRTLADRLGATVAWKSDGVPFFIFEMIRALKDGGILEQRPDGSLAQTQAISEIQVPSAVKDLIEARLRTLTEGQRAILDVGAVEGEAFDPDLVARVLEEKKVRVLRDLADVERRSGIVRGEAGLCRFDQYQIQEVLYRSLMPDLRTEYHALLADARAEREGVRNKPAADVPGEVAAFLALHHLKGSRPADALPWLEPALDHLERTYANDEATDLATRALAVKGMVTGARRIGLLMRVAAGLDLLGRRAEQRTALEEAVRLADASDDPALRARTRHGLGVHHYMRAEYEQARDLAKEALELAKRAGDRTLEMLATRALGNALGNMGLIDEQYALQTRSLEIAREVGHKDGQAAATINLAHYYSAAGRRDEAQDGYARGIALAEQVGNKRWEANARAGLGSLLLDLGRVAEAEPEIQRSLSRHRDIGNRHGEVQGLLGVSGFTALTGRREESRAHAEAAVSIAREIGDRALEGSAIATLADAAEEDGDSATAERLRGEAVDVFRALARPEYLAGVLLSRADARLRAGRPKEAAADVEAADEAL